MRLLKGLLVLTLLVACVAIEIRYDVDFLGMHGTAVRVAEGELSKVYKDPVGLRGVHYFYGPVSLVLIKPIGFLSFAFAKTIWILIQCAAFGIFWWGLYRFFPKLSQGLSLWGLALVVMINPVHNNFQSNNIQLMMIAALFIAFFLLEQKKVSSHLIGGAIVVLAAYIKIYPAFIAAFLLLAFPRKVWKGYLLGTTLALLLPLICFGWEASLGLYKDHFQSLFSYHTDNPLSGSYTIQCLPALLAHYVPSKLFSLLILALVSLSFFIWEWKKRKEIQERPETAHFFFFFALALTVFLNPSSFIHYLVFFVPLTIWVGSGVRPALSTAFLVLGVLFMAFTAEGVVGKNLSRLFMQWDFVTIGMILILLSATNRAVSISPNRLSPPVV